MIEEPAETPPGKLETIIGFNGEQKQHKNLVDVHHPESSARIQKIWELRDRRLNSEDQHLKLVGGICNFHIFHKFRGSTVLMRVI